MNRYINADKILYKDLSEGRGVCWVAFKDWIDEMPSADVRENVKGEWGRTKNGFIYCSNCEATWYDNAWTDKWRYCPNCGAQMER